MDDVVLWHFPISHYNEKVRWTLDLKRISHRRRALGPDYLVRALWATGKPTLPVLFIGRRAIGDSTRIIAALEELVPAPAVYPRDEALRRRALELEDRLDEGLGPAVRSALVGTLFMSEDAASAVDVITTGMPPFVTTLLRSAFPAFRRYYFHRHRIDGARVEAYRRMVLEEMDRLERERRGRDYLVGDAFSVADLTAAAMLCAIVEPPQMQYPPAIPYPAALAEFRDAVLRHPLAAWTGEMYRRHRGTSAEVGGVNSR
jgi:glutathione S-transferase